MRKRFAVDKLKPPTFSIIALLFFIIFFTFFMCGPVTSSIITFAKGEKMLTIKIKVQFHVLKNPTLVHSVVIRLLLVWDDLFLVGSSTLFRCILSDSFTTPTSGVCVFVAFNTFYVVMVTYRVKNLMECNNNNK